MDHLAGDWSHLLLLMSGIGVLKYHVLTFAKVAGKSNAIVENADLIQENLFKFLPHVTNHFIRIIIGELKF